MRVRDFDFLLLGTAMALFRNLVWPRTRMARGKGRLLTQPGAAGKRQTAGFSSLDRQTKMAGPKAGQGMQEGRRCFALARSLIGSAPTAIVNKGMSLNNGAHRCCAAFRIGVRELGAYSSLHMGKLDGRRQDATGLPQAGRVKIASRLRKFIPFFK